MTAVPAARKALVSAIQAASGPRVLALNGPWLQRPSEADVIVVGWLPDEGATVDFEETQAGLDSTREDFDIAGMVSSWNGDGDMGAAVDRSDELVEAIRGAINADRTLGGVVTRARLQTVSFSDHQTAQGAESALEFSVRVTAFRMD